MKISLVGLGGCGKTSLYSVAFAEKRSIPMARNALEKIKPKLPCATKTVLERLKH